MALIMTNCKVFLVVYFLLRSCEIRAEAITTDKCSHLKNPNENPNAYIVNRKLCCMCPAGEFISEDCNETFPHSTMCKPCPHNDEVKSYITFGPHMERTCTIQSDLHCSKVMVFQEGSRTREASCECPGGMRKVGRFECENVVDTTTSSTMRSSTSTLRKATTSVPRSTIVPFAKGVTEATKVSKKQLESVPGPVSFENNDNDKASTTTVSEKEHTPSEAEPTDGETKQSTIKVPDNGQEDKTKEDPNGKFPTVVIFLLVGVATLLVVIFILRCLVKKIGCFPKTNPYASTAEEGQGMMPYSNHTISNSSSIISVQSFSEINKHVDSGLDTTDETPSSQEQYDHYQNTTHGSTIYDIMIHGEDVPFLNEAGPIADPQASSEPTERGPVQEHCQSRQPTEQGMPDSPIMIIQGGRIQNGAGPIPNSLVQVHHMEQDGPYQEFPQGDQPYAEAEAGMPQRNEADDQPPVRDQNFWPPLSEKLAIHMAVNDMKPFCRKLLGSERDNWIDEQFKKYSGGELMYQILKEAHQCYGREFIPQFVVNTFKKMDPVKKLYVEMAKQFVPNETANAS